MQLLFFLSEKISQKKERKAKKKERKRVTPGWTDISGLVPASFLSRNPKF